MIDIPCTGIHYTAAANRISSILNPEWAQFQINYFVEHDIWLEDKEISILFKDYVYKNSAL